MNFNQRNGLKSKSTRAATHAPALATNQRCPACTSRHVLATVSTNGRARGAYWCALCSHFFDVHP